MNKCKHNNIEILEFGTAFTSHIRENGKWTHANGYGDYTVKIEVTCLDCEFFATYYKTKPKWLEKYIEEFNY